MAKVLVVEDSATMRMILMKGIKKAAEASGKAVPSFVQADNGQSAIEQLAKNSDVDLVVCDVNMPGMNGIEFVRHLRQSSVVTRTECGDKAVFTRSKNEVPVVMVTTETSLERVQECLGAGANDYLRKPFTHEHLVEKVCPYLD